ncbi:MAG: hypothetical protein ACTSRN_03605 [Alphaproteobacteria bacterium]
MRFSIIIVLLAIMACSSPGKHFSGATPVRVTVEGSIFDIYTVGSDVKAVRLSVEALPRRAVIGARAIIAIEQATGCKFVAGSMTGDQALMQARITCSA